MFVTRTLTVGCARMVNARSAAGLPRPSSSSGSAPSASSALAFDVLQRCRCRYRRSHRSAIQPRSCGWVHCRLRACCNCRDPCPWPRPAHRHSQSSTAAGLQESRTLRAGMASLRLPMAILRVEEVPSAVRSSCSQFERLICSPPPDAYSTVNWAFYPMLQKIVYFFGDSEPVFLPGKSALAISR